MNEDFVLTIMEAKGLSQEASWGDLDGRNG